VQQSASARFVIKSVDGVKLGRQPVDSPFPAPVFVIANEFRRYGDGIAS
jgi:hypothetical protein